VFGSLLGILVLVGAVLYLMGNARRRAWLVGGRGFLRRHPDWRDAEFMPWPSYSKFYDDELKAI
jgi:hypothetical protein